MEHLQDAGCNICFVQETWLKEADTAKLQQIQDYGWNILSNPRKYRSGGGIAFLYRKWLKLKLNEKVVKYKSFQVMEALLETTLGSVRLINVYRPGYSKKARHTQCDFLEEYEEYLSDLKDKSGCPIIAGDFNFHVEKPNDLYPKKYLDLLNAYGFHQCTPLVPTHISGGTLDHIVMNASLTQIIDGPIEVLPSGTKSDHYLVVFKMSMGATVRAVNGGDNIITYRNYNALDIDEFKSDIRRSNLGERSKWSLYDLNGTVKLYDRVLQELMDKHCPLIEKKVKNRDKPWEDEELRTLLRKRRAAENAWRKGNGQRETYVTLRKQFFLLEREKRTSYYRASLLKSSGDTKMLFKKLNRLLGNSAQILPSSATTNPGKCSEEYKDFFGNKVDDIRQDVEDELKILSPAGSGSGEGHYGDADASGEPDIHVDCRFGEFTALSLEELKDLIVQLSNKFCDLDPIPSFLLKKCVDELAPVLLHAVNMSLCHGEFPSSLKSAIVKPTIKKNHLDADCLKNYRPVSNLSIVSKLLERVALNQLNRYLEENDLHCSLQSGYRPNHSCETLLVRVSDDVLREIHSDNIVIVVLLDLSAAFDTIDHSILLNKLLTDFGICGKAHEWFKSYLKDRSFRVKIGKSLSDFLCLLFGVPQGSLLGPILFILYIKYLEVIAAKYGLSIKLYADDSQLYISFHPQRPSELDDVTARTNACLKEIKAWMVSNYMKLNEGKTELLVIGRPHILKKFNLEITLQFGSTVITPTACKGDNWKSLGIKLDQALNMDRQINSVKQKCYWTMTNLRTIGRYLDESVKLMMVKQLVISKIDYCNALYMNLSKTRLRKLGSLLNNGVRFIYGVTDRDVDLLPYYKKAHILPIQERIFFKVCLITYKVINGLAPPYLRQLVELEGNQAGRTRSTSTVDDYRLKVPKMPMLNTSLMSRRFTHYAPTAWNSLPLEIRSISTIFTFKRILKNHLYNML